MSLKVLPLPIHYRPDLWFSERFVEERKQGDRPYLGPLVGRHGLYKTPDACWVEAYDGAWQFDPYIFNMDMERAGRPRYNIEDLHSMIKILSVPGLPAPAYKSIRREVALEQQIRTEQKYRREARKRLSDFKKEKGIK
jgi:hypothetical protein